MDTLILSFGRMNPPTIGHAKLWNKLESLAREYNGDALLCLSKSQDKKKNPLDFNTKSRIIQQYVDEMGVNILVEDESTFADKAANIYMILPQIYREGQYKNIIFVCGSDRLEDFQSLKAYNGKPAKNEKLYYEFDSIEIESSGERDADSDDAASKASASLVRSLATEGDFDTFLQFMPDGGSNEGLAREVYDSIREAMGVEKLTEATRMNKHQSHLEDIIVDGEEGFRELLDKIDSMKAILSGSSDTEAESLSITTKIDGSPALLIWSNIDGVDGPGISLKGIIESKSPEAAQKVILTSEDQINAKYGDRPDMANKLRIVLRALLDGSLKVPDGKVVQGDLLFDSNTVDHIVEDGVEYTAFQPNTILYAVPSDSELASKINSSQVGVAFHTVYSGGIGNFSQSFKLKVATFFESIPEDFFIIDCNVPDFSGWVSFTADETEELNSNISQLHNYYQELTSTHDTEYKLLCENEEFIKMYFQTFQNKVISDKQTNFFNEETFIDDLREHCIGRIENTRAKKIASLKTEKGREKANAKLDAEKQEILDILDNDLEVISIIVKATNLASKIKLEFIEKLKNAKQLFGTFYKTSQGLIPGTQEGFAVSDNDGNIVKLVDRSCFSFHNRSADTVKGWQHSNDKMTERKTVQVTFEDDHRADLFIQFLKDEFNIPETKSRYLVVSGKDENGRSVFVENRKRFNEESEEIDKSNFKALDKVNRFVDFIKSLNNDDIISKFKDIGFQHRSESTVNVVKYDNEQSVIFLDVKELENLLISIYNYIYPSDNVKDNSNIDQDGQNIQDDDKKESDKNFSFSKKDNEDLFYINFNNDKNNKLSLRISGGGQGLCYFPFKEETPTVKPNAPLSTALQEQIQAILLQDILDQGRLLEGIEVKDFKNLLVKDINKKEEEPKMFGDFDLGESTSIIENNTGSLTKLFYIKSSKSIKNVLEKYSNKGYKVLHPNMKLKDKEKSLVDILFSKNVSNKDVVNPADLYIVKVSEIDNIIENLKDFIIEKKNNINLLKYGTTFSQTMNNLSSLRDDNEIGICIPVSLKMSSNPQMEVLINSPEILDKLIESNSFEISNIKFNPTGNQEISFRYKDVNSKDDEDKKIEYFFAFRRKGTSAKSWQCDCNKRGNKDALDGGSVKTIFNLTLECNNQELDQYFTDENIGNNFNQIVNSFGDKITINDSDINKNEFTDYMNNLNINSSSEKSKELSSLYNLIMSTEDNVENVSKIISTKKSSANEFASTRFGMMGLSNVLLYSSKRASKEADITQIFLRILKLGTKRSEEIADSLKIH